MADLLFKFCHYTSYSFNHQPSVTQGRPGRFKFFYKQEAWGVGWSVSRSSYRIAVLCLVTQSCLTFCDVMDYSQTCSSVHGDSTSKNTGVGCQVLLQGIFPTQGSNPGRETWEHYRRILHRLSHQGSPEKFL